MDEAAKDTGQVGVVIVTHTDYGARLLKAAEFIIGAQDACRSVSVDMTHEVDKILVAMKTAIKETDTGAGVLILTDMFGGTPTNLSLSLLGEGNLEVLTGVNLPMLIKILTSRQKPLQTLASEAKIAGCQGIVVAGEVLRSKVAEG
ncbi:PTS sugar transporter subunit IIA [Desulfovibrio inopinatus]|uniref:PTS sugar transporter subunit IIA n=1 Tax=Desulfovibrio inopinatus TaxID=102109 RepID=UPI0004099D13|nr:PTS sugar transporter subunit IIA [Desulfovibrio inopinatus]